MSNWLPHIFRGIAEAEGCSLKFIDILEAEGMRLASRGLPVVFTLGHLSRLVGAPLGLLESVVSRKSDPYRVFKLRKRGKTEQYRLITIPSPALINAQRWIHHNILMKQPVHNCSTAFGQGCSPKDNAERHCGARWLVKTDITNFFESITEQQVYRVFLEIGIRPQLAFQLSRICTRVSEKSFKYKYRRWNKNGVRLGHLPQGSPTSPILANLVCRTLDEDMSVLALKYRCTYSRYADDIVFSSSSLSRAKASEIIATVSEKLEYMGFRRNRRKTTVSPPGARKIVTGLLVDQKKPRLPREFKDKINLHLFHAQKHGIWDHCKQRSFRSIIGFRAHLHGLITFAENVDPAYGSLCRKRFEDLAWGELSEFPIFI